MQYMRSEQIFSLGRKGFWGLFWFINTGCGSCRGCFVVVFISPNVVGLSFSDGALLDGVRVLETVWKLNHSS